ncbi:MAG: hypothetical protein MHM6MM_003677, partial [Cercozoa sp. M6MM]
MRIAATSEAEPLDLSHVFSQQCTLSLLSTPPVSPPPVLSEHIQLSVEARRSLRRKLVQVEGEVTLAPVPTVRVPTVQDQTQFAALATTKTVDAPVEGRYDASDAALLRRMRQHVEERRRALEAERRRKAAELERQRQEEERARLQREQARREREEKLKKEREALQAAEDRRKREAEAAKQKAALEAKQAADKKKAAAAAAEAQRQAQAQLLKQ